MTLSLISVLSQDVTALWLLLKTSAGVWALRSGRSVEVAVVCCKSQGWGGLCMTIEETRWARSFGGGRPIVGSNGRVQWGWGVPELARL